MDDRDAENFIDMLLGNKELIHNMLSTIANFEIIQNSLSTLQNTEGFGHVHIMDMGPRVVEHALNALNAPPEQLNRPVDELPLANPADQIPLELSIVPLDNLIVQSSMEMTSSETIVIPRCDL